jgi:hypothetical protein
VGRSWLAPAGNVISTYTGDMTWTATLDLGD